jgi:hypothetical protein
VGPAEPFLIDRSNAGLASGAGEARPPRPVGLWKCLRLIDKTAGGHIFLGFLFCLFILPAPIGIACLISGFRAARREYRLQRHGRVILGEVRSFGEMTAHGHEQGPEGTLGAPTSWVVPYVTFAFTTPDGRVLTSWASISPRKPSEIPPRPGQAVAVLYLDDENYRTL